MGRYSDRLLGRLRSDQKTGISFRNLKIEVLPDEFEIVVPPHPMKYPNHKGSKGSVLGGVCNVTRCDRPGAWWFNKGTKGYYCAECARGIDYNSRVQPLCIAVDHNLTHEEMDALA